MSSDTGSRAWWGLCVPSRCPAASVPARSVSWPPATGRWRAGQRRPGGITRRGFTSTNAPGVRVAARTPGGPSSERSTGPPPGGADRRAADLTRRSARFRCPEPAGSDSARVGRDRRAACRTGMAHALRLDSGRLQRYRTQAERHRRHAGVRSRVRGAAGSPRLVELRRPRGSPTARCAQHSESSERSAPISDGLRRYDGCFPLLPLLSWSRNSPVSKVTCIPCFLQPATSSPSSSKSCQKIDCPDSP